MFSPDKRLSTMIPTSLAAFALSRMSVEGMVSPWRRWKSASSRFSVNP